MCCHGIISRSSDQEPCIKQPGNLIFKQKLCIKNLANWSLTNGSQKSSSCWQKLMICHRIMIPDQIAISDCHHQFLMSFHCWPRGLYIYIYITAALKFSPWFHLQGINFAKKKKKWSDLQKSSYLYLSSMIIVLTDLFLVIDYP